MVAALLYLHTLERDVNDRLFRDSQMWPCCAGDEYYYYWVAETAPFVFQTVSMHI